MSQGRLHGSRASAPEPCRCVSLGNVHPPDLRSIHPALTDLAGGRMPSGLFGANAAWWTIMIWTIMILAHNLNAVMKRLVLGPAWGA